MPDNKKSESFFNDKIKEHLSDNYKKGRNDYNINNRSGETVDDLLYNPIGFKTFGDYDLAVFSLIDDISYPHRIFHSHKSLMEPENSGNKESSNDSYDYQVITCINTYKGKDAYEGPQKHKLSDLFNPPSKKFDKYPYLSISKAKITNYFLMGNGIIFSDLVKNKLYALCEEYNKGEEKPIEIIVLDSLGSEELVIVSFSKNLSSLIQFVHEARCLQLESLRTVNEDQYNEIISNKLDIFSLDEKINWKETHVFSAMNSIGGYRIDLVENKVSEYDFLPQSFSDPDNSVYIEFVWDIKPGHAKKFYENLRQKGRPYKLNFEEVDSDPLRLYNSAWRYKLPVPDETDHVTVTGFINQIEFLRKFDSEHSHTRRLRMKVYLKNESGILSFLQPVNEFDEINHPKPKLYKGRLVFSPSILIGLRKNFNKANISKLLRERVMKMYNNYNSCISDPMYFSSFTDLVGFMITLASESLDYCKGDYQSSIDFNEWMNVCVESFEQAYFNRFHQSTRINEIPEFNIEWNGGIQQILSSLDCAFKELSDKTYKTHYYQKFVYVSGYERVRVSENTLRINMLYVTYPELFATSIYKEVFNFLGRESLRKDYAPEALTKFRDPNYPSFLKECIERQAGYDMGNSVHKFLLSKIDREHINTFIADFLSYNYGYACDYDLFSHSYWKHLLQTSMFYDRCGQLDHKMFVSFLTRMLFVFIITSKEAEETEEAEEAEESYEMKFRFTPENTAISDLWMRYYNDVLIFVKCLCTILRWHKFKSTFYDLINVLKEEELTNENLQLMKDRINLSQRKNIPDDIVSVLYEVKIKKDVGLIIEKFKQNRIHEYKDGDNASYFVTSLSRAFLKYMYELDMENITLEKGKSISHVLERDEEGKPKLEDMEGCFSNILSDPHGGLFCINSSIQKKSLSARIVYYRSLYHFCMKRKNKNISELADRMDDLREKIQS